MANDAILVGRETTFGTAATLTRAYEAQADTWKRLSESKESRGIMAGFDTIRADRTFNSMMGCEGTIALDFLEEGMGQLLQASFGTSTQAVVSGTAYKQTHSTDPDAPGDSFTVQWQRHDMSGAQHNFTHLGCAVTGWKISQAVRDFLKFEFQFDGADVVTNVAAGTPVYPDAAPLFWAMTSLTWGGQGECMETFELNADLALKTDRYCLDDQAKKQQVRGGQPAFTGTMSGEFKNINLYDDYVANAIKPLVATWTGTPIGTSGEDHTLVLTMPAVQLTGESPVVNLDDTPTQGAPFVVLHDAVEGPAITCEYTTTQDTLVV